MPNHQHKHETGRTDIYPASKWRLTMVCFRAQMRTAPDRLKHPLGFDQPCPRQALDRAA